MNTEEMKECPKCGAETEEDYLVTHHGELMCEGCAQSSSDNREYPNEEYGR
jgi:formylmethanofuran dehydrogenase subunit E